jgi:hypothetical protein
VGDKPTQCLECYESFQRKLHFCSTGCGTDLRNESLHAYDVKMCSKCEYELFQKWEAEGEAKAEPCENCGNKLNWNTGQCYTCDVCEDCGDMLDINNECYECLHKSDDDDESVDSDTTEATHVPTIKTTFILKNNTSEPLPLNGLQRRTWFHEQIDLCVACQDPATNGNTCDDCHTWFNEQ